MPTSDACFAIVIYDTSAEHLTEPSRTHRLIHLPCPAASLIQHASRSLILATARMKSFYALVALATSVMAQPLLTNSNYNIAVGVPFTITWSNATGPVTLLLKNGPSGALETVSTIACKSTSVNLVIR